MAWCEANDVGYVLGLARNKRLERALGKEMEAARVACERTGEAARRFGDFRYRTRKSWSCERRVIGKAEYLPGKANPRFVVTNLSPHEVGAQRLYEELYCARGEMETGSRSSNWPVRRSHQQRDPAGESTAAVLLFLCLCPAAWPASAGSDRYGICQAQSTTIRLKLLKIGARLRLTARKVWLSFSEAYPYASDIARILANLDRHPAWSPPG